MTSTTQNIASDAFNAFFKYPIGTLLFPKEIVAAWLVDAEVNGPLTSRLDRVQVPTGMVVVERLLQQCHGGIQGFYVVRRRITKPDGDHVDSLERYAALELVPWEEIIAACRAMAPVKKERGAWDAAADAAAAGLAAMGAAATYTADAARSVPMPPTDE